MITTLLLAALTATVLVFFSNVTDGFILAKSKLQGVVLVSSSSHIRKLVLFPKLTKEIHWLAEPPHPEANPPLEAVVP